MIFFSIIGTTSVGKTSTALWLAKQLIGQKKFSGVDLISADSRQVYRGLEIISGADIPQNLSPKIKLHGISMLEPDEDWSVAHFQKLVLNILEKSQQTNRLVLVVGGTGLYHQQILNSDGQLNIGPNKEIRGKAEKMSLVDLQTWAKKVNSARFTQLNQSDVNNPRRLIRLIEISLANKKPANKISQFDQVYLGLTKDFCEIESAIKQRVFQRFNQGAIKEVENLLAQYDDWSLPALSTTGVKEIKGYLDDDLNQEECLKLWTLTEIQYARRQLTWWKKLPVEWFDLGKPKWQDELLAYILKSC